MVMLKSGYGGSSAPPWRLFLSPWNHRNPYSICVSTRPYCCLLRTAKQESCSEHVPVLLEEVIEQFKGRKLSSFVDCTLGAGGHTCGIIKSHPELETFIGLDADPVAHSIARPRIEAAIDSQFGAGTSMKLFLFQCNFKHVSELLPKVDESLLRTGVDGMLMDLGVSSMQVESSHRGFSYHHDAPVDMRMDPSESLHAEHILNNWPESEIGRILREYGEEKRWKYLAHKIVDARLSGGITSTSQLVQLIGGRFYKQAAGTGQRKKHPAMRTFQALRIAVNDELRSLELALAEALACLAPNGRLAVISFHSLEDRIVKHHFLHAAGLQTPLDIFGDGMSQQEKGKFRILTKKPITPTVDEIRKNPKCRSSKLRVIEKV